MEIVRLEKKQYDEWDLFCDKSPQGSIYCKSWYLDALGVNYKILAVIENSSISAGIILTRNEIWASSNPLLVKYLGVLFPEPEGNRYHTETKKLKLTEALINEIKKVSSFDYSFHPAFLNWLPFYHTGYSQQTYYSYIIDFFGRDFTEIQAGFHKKLRNEISFAQKNGVTINENIGLDNLYDLISASFLAAGNKNPFNKQKIGNFIIELTLRKAFASFGAAGPDGKIIAAAGIAYDRKCSYLLFNGVDYNNLCRGANEYVISKAIEYAHYVSERFDFEGSMLKPVESFYRKFGGDYSPYMRIWKDNLFNFVKRRGLKLYKQLRYGK